MSFRKFVSEAQHEIRSACHSLKYETPEQLEWNIPSVREFGDLSFRTGYQLAQAVRKKPPQIVAELAEEITKGATGMKYIESVEGHPSGFLNFKLKRKTYFQDVLRAAQEIDYGRLDIGKSTTVLVEHTSVNPNKALHVGHLRNVALGDSIARIFRFTNHDVKVLNYVDDSGLQVADVIVGIKYLGFSKESSTKKFDHYVGDDIYVSVNKKYEIDSTLALKRTLVLRAIEERDKEIFPLASEITNKILLEQLKTCWRFNAFYDLLVFESDIIASRLWEEAFDALKKREIAKLETNGKFSGCWIVTVKGEKEGEDKVLVRSDGTATYIAKDIPFAALKMGIIQDRFSYDRFVLQPDQKDLFRTRVLEERTGQSPVTWGAEKSITAIGSEQSRLQRVILHVLEQLSGKDLSQRYIHLSYALMTLSPSTVVSITSGGNQEGDTESVRMSGRKGLYVNADDVFDAVKSSALDETRKRNSDIKDDSWFENVAEKIAISAVRFSLLKQDLDKTIMFDLSDSLKLIGETGPYMLYTYARASSILERVSDSKGRIDSLLLNSESEVELMTLISKFDLNVEKAVNMLAPKWIAHYSFELCEAFNKFYEKNRVLQVEQDDLRATRIELVSAFRNVLKRSLDLLGIDCLEKI